MREAGLSLTAQRVAAYRLGFERQPAAFGDPAADLRLGHDVVGPGGADNDGPMARYLQARTTFFDRVLLNALERGTTQVVLVGAGYDGRALRYAKPGVDWFELDHPATQADKRERLGRLGLHAPHIHFVEADFNRGGVAEALLAGGYQPGVPSVLLCEGVVVYLDRPVLEGLLTDLRAVSAHGSRLGISFSVAGDDHGGAARRRRFAEGVGVLGEPALTVLGSGEAAVLLGTAGWAVREVSDRARRAGLLVAETAWAPAGGAGQGAAAGDPNKMGADGMSADGMSADEMSADEMMERISYRAGVDGLARHLEAAYGVVVARLAPLDVGVYRVDRADGVSWVARLFPRSRPVDDVRGDAAILGLLEDEGFPAERLPHSGAVTVYEGQGLLVTWFVAGATPDDGPGTYRLLGDLLGRLHTMGTDGPAARPGGAWHHLVNQGHVDEELAAALALVRGSALRVPAGQESLYRSLEEELASWPRLGGLPEALVHPDFVPPNMVSSPVGLVVVDWAGAGQGSRLAGLGFTLWAAGARGQGCIDALVRAYRPYVRLEPEELDRLEAAIGFRRLVLQSWAFCVGRQSLARVVDRLPAARAHSAAVAARARPLLR